MAWESRPVFVSSTFADMQAERDHLRTHVFPALEERLRSRRRHLEWVDLRLGVVAASYQDAEMRELQVLKVCLGEVQRCRPFLIVLLGDRYGWVPPPERIAAAAREVGFDENITGRSVTDLEIQFGILGDKEQQPHCFFYFRQPLPYADMPRKVAAAYADAYGTDPDAATRCKRFAALKGEIEASLPERIRRYTAGWDSERQCVTGLDAWGQTVLEDLWSEILATTAASGAEAEISWQQAEREALDDYIEDRTRDFIGRASVLSHLGELACSAAQDGATWGVCLTAPPGTGKSAIFGELHKRLKRQGVFVLAHAAAASARAASVDDMLRRWIEELGAALETDHGLADNADTDTIDATFHALLGQMASERRVVVLVDGLDQFEATTRGRFATWLPRLWPADARLIATAVPCDASKALEARAGVRVLPLPPLDANEARWIAEMICARYHRTLEPEVLDALLAKRGKTGPAWGNTLWLVLAVEELNLVDGDDFGRAMRTYTGSTAEQLRALMLDIVADLPTDVLGLYTESFERAEKLFGMALAQAFLGFVAISRTGWRESDFRVLLPRATGEEWDELRFASLRRLFRGQIRQRGAMGQWDVNHAQMRAAVRQYLRKRNIAETKLHAFAVQHLLLSLSADDPLRQSETMVHLLGSQDWLLAAEFYGSGSLTQPELAGATRVLADTILASQQAGQMNGLDQVLHILRAVGHIPGKRAEETVAHIAGRLQTDLESMLAERGELSSRTILLEATGTIFARLVKAHPDYVGWTPSLCVALDRAAHILRVQGNLVGALARVRQCRELAERLVEADPTNAGWQHDLSVAHSKIGDVLMAQGNRAEALSSLRQSWDIAERLARADPANAALQFSLSILLNKIGDVLLAQGNRAEALSSYRQSRDIAAPLAKANPANAGWQRDLSVSLNNIGYALEAQSNLAEALASFRQCRDIRERLAAADPANVERQRDLAATLGMIGLILHNQSNLAEALSSFRQCRDISERLAKADPENAGWQRDLYVASLGIGDILLAQGNTMEGLSSYRQSRDIAEGLAKADPGNVLRQRDFSIVLDKIGELLAAQGNPSEALSCYRQSHDIAERLAKADPGDSGRQLDLSVVLDKIGELLVTQGNPAEALSNHQQSNGIVERLAKADPSNGELQRALTLSFERLAILKLMLKAHKDANDLFKQGRDIIVRLKARTPNDTILSEDLARFDRHLAEVEQLTAPPIGGDRQVRAASAEAQDALGVSHGTMGNKYFQSGNLGAALESYEKARASFQQLVAYEPGSIKWQRNLAGSHGSIAAVHRTNGDLTKALESFRAAYSIFEHLAKIDPGDIEWQGALSVQAVHIGDVLLAQETCAQALVSYQQSQEIIKRLVHADPANLMWQFRLSSTYEKIGDVLRAQNQRPEALASYQESWNIFERLATTDPTNPAWQLQLKVLLYKIGDVLVAQGDPASSDLPAARATDKAPPATSKASKPKLPPATDGVDGVDWMRVPDAVRQRVLPVDPPPDWIDGFRFARTADGFNDDGSPRISPERGYVAGTAERDRLLAYLGSGTIVVDSWARGPDLIDPTRQLAVPARFRTDGTWVWPGSVEYYLRWHNVAPEPELRARAEQWTYRCPAVETAVVARVRAAIDHRADLIQKNVDAYMAKHPELRPGDPDRFEADVNEGLLAIGWTRGRDISTELFEWLAPRVAELSEKFSEQTGSSPYAPFPAAVAVMREFGGLVSMANGPGQTSAQVPFVIYPAPHDDLIGFAPDIQELSETIGTRAFQVGEVERGMGALVVDESGRVFLVGPVQLYAGANIDEALTRMLRGIRCEQLSEVGQ